MSGETFAARYPGRCGICDREFDEGDSVGYIDGEICHRECIEEEEEGT
jgi:hypothetical protein